MSNITKNKETRILFILSGILWMIPTLYNGYDVLKNLDSYRYILNATKSSYKPLILIICISTVAIALSYLFVSLGALFYDIDMLKKGAFSLFVSNTALGVDLLFLLQTIIDESGIKNTDSIYRDILNSNMLVLYVCFILQSISLYLLYHLVKQVYEYKLVKKYKYYLPVICYLILILLLYIFSLDINVSLTSGSLNNSLWSYLLILTNLLISGIALESHYLSNNRVITKKNLLQNQNNTINQSDYSNQIRNTDQTNNVQQPIYVAQPVFVNQPSEVLHPMLVNQSSGIQQPIYVVQPNGIQQPVYVVQPNTAQQPIYIVQPNDNISHQIYIQQQSDTNSDVKS